MADPNTRIPTDETARRDFETGTVQPGPGMAPEQPPAEDMEDPKASEDVRNRGASGEEQGTRQQKPSDGGCGCGCG